MLAHAVFELLPLWAWIAIVLVLVAAIAAITSLGLWAPILAVLRAGAATFRALPTNVKLVIIVALALAIVALAGRVWLNYHDDKVAAYAVKVRDAYWKEREDQANENERRELADLHRKLEHANDNATANGQKAAKALADNAALRAAQRAAGDKERNENVTQNAVAACGDLHRGVIVQFNREAARANGEAVDESAADAAARRETADATSGVALDTYSAAAGETQRALGQARDQLIGWNHFYDDVLTPWYAELRAALSTCVPQGGSP